MVDHPQFFGVGNISFTPNSGLPNVGLGLSVSPKFCAEPQEFPTTSSTKKGNFAGVPGREVLEVKVILDAGILS
jgi:hypothetical protein